MKIFAYCAKSFERAARRAAGVDPITCPPVTAETFDIARLQGHDLIYFDLHGDPGSDYWYEQSESGFPIVALTSSQICQADLSGAVVFGVNCYLADENSPMMDALLDAGAEYVIGAPGQNYGGTESQIGATLLARSFRLLSMFGAEPLEALAMAKVTVKMQRAAGEFKRVAARTIGASSAAARSESLVNAAEDTLEFKAFYRET